MAPKPPALVTPRPSRGAPRSCVVAASTDGGPNIAPKPPALGTPRLSRGAPRLGGERGHVPSEVAVAMTGAGLRPNRRAQMMPTS